VAASLYFMRRAFGHRLSPVVRMSVVRHVLSFSAATYISSLFNLFPLLLIPLIVLDRDGAQTPATILWLSSSRTCSIRWRTP